MFFSKINIKLKKRIKGIFISFQINYSNFLEIKILKTFNPFFQFYIYFTKKHHEPSLWKCLEFLTFEHYK